MDKETPVPTEAVSVTKKDRVLNFSRIFISLLLLSIIIIINRKHFNAIYSSILNVKVLFLILSAAACMFSLWVESLRWNTLLRAQGKRISAGYLFVSMMVGFFYNNLLPSNIGGDFYRVYDVSKNKKIPLKISFASVFLERFFGLISIALYFLITSFTIYRILKNYVIIISIFLTIAFFLFSMLIKPEFFKIDRLFKKFKKLQKIEKGFASFRSVMNIYGGRMPYLILGIFLTLTADVFIMAAYYFVSLSLGLNLNFMTFAFIVPVIFVLTGIPVSIGGLGVRENAIVFMLAGFGVLSGTAALFSFLVLFVFIFNAVAGGVIYLCKNVFYKSKTFI